MPRPTSRANRISNNGGFSLVELLVAVVILGIIVAPMLHAFVSGANTAARSRRAGDATLASQNIAETIEANSLSDLVKMEDNNLYGGTVTSSTLNAGIYDLTVTDMKAGNSTFNTRISFDPKTDSTFNNINAVPMADYTNMDAVFAQTQSSESDPDQIAKNKFLAELASHTDAATDGIPKRVITLTVTSADNGKKLMAQLKYSYIFSYTETVVVGGTTETKAGTYEDTESYTLFPEGFSVEDHTVPGIYVMYNPMYNNKAEGGDSIMIDNSQDQIFNLFLVKQKTAGSTQSDGGYTAKVILKNKSDFTNESEKPQVFSNAGENLYSPYNKIVTVRYFIQTGDYIRAPKDDFNGEGALVSKTERNRIYDVTIKIYKADDTEYKAPVSTFTTTKLQ